MEQKYFRQMSNFQLKRQLEMLLAIFEGGKKCLFFPTFASLSWTKQNHRQNNNKLYIKKFSRLTVLPVLK
jgi:hypothetical protein